MRKLLIITQLLITLYSFSQNGQYTYAYKKYGAQDGLPGRTINYLYQDSKGFVWIATDNGVCRYDGVSFKKFTANDNLENNEVFRIAEDHNGRIFFYCNNYRVCCYDKGKILSAAELGLNEKMSVPPFGSFFFDSNNMLCINAGFEQCRYSFSPFKKETCFDTTGSSGKMYYGFGNDSVSLNPSMINLLKSDLNKLFNGLPDVHINPFRIALEKNYVLLLSKKAVVVYELQKDHLKRLREIDLPPDVNAVDLMGNNMISVTSFRQGLTTLEYLTGEIKEFLPGIITTHSLADKEGNIWVGTYDKGLFFCASTAAKLINDETGLKSNNVFSLYYRNGILFAGHDLSGISVLPVQDKPVVKSFTIRTQKSDFNNISCMAQFGDGSLLIGTNRGMYRVISNAADPALWPQQQVSEGSVKDIKKNGDTVFYVSYNALNMLLPPGKTEAKKLILDSLRLTCLQPQKDGSFLLGTLNGLYRLSWNYLNGQHNIQSIYPNIRSVKCIAEADDRLAVGTDDNGVFLIAGDTCRHLDFPIINAASVNKLIWTDSATLWICTGNGCSAAEFGTNDSITKIRSVNTGNGLPSDLVYDLCKASGKFFIATAEGITVLDETWNDTSMAPLIVNEDSFSVSDLTYGEHIAFHFAGISFKSLGNIKYQYRLSGLDTGWNFTTERSKEYDVLPAGDYTFEVRAVDRLGNVSSSMMRSFTVHPLWYQQWWVKLLALLVIVVVLFLIVRNYYLTVIRLQKKEFEKILAVQQERHRISTEMHDDIGAGLSGIRLQAEMLGKKSSSAELQQEVNKIHHSISDITSKVKEVIWSLNAENDSLANLISFIHQQAHKMFENSSTRLRISTVADLPQVNIAGEKRRHIYLVIKEAMHNIIKHSEAQYALVDFSYDTGILKILIRDDGKGMNDGNNKNGMGLNNMKQRAAKLGASLRIESGAGGTAISINLPVNV